MNVFQQDFVSNLRMRSGCLESVCLYMYIWKTPTVGSGIFETTQIQYFRMTLLGMDSRV